MPRASESFRAPSSPPQVGLALSLGVTKPLPYLQHRRLVLRHLPQADLVDLFRRGVNAGLCSPALARRTTTLRRVSGQHLLTHKTEYKIPLTLASYGYICPVVCTSGVPWGESNAS